MLLIFPPKSLEEKSHLPVSENLCAKYFSSSVISLFFSKCMFKENVFYSCTWMMNDYFNRHYVINFHVIFFLAEINLCFNLNILLQFDLWILLHGLHLKCSVYFLLLINIFITYSKMDVLTKTSHNLKNVSSYLGF